MLAYLLLALIATIVKFAWLLSGVYAGFSMSLPSFVLDAGTVGILHRTQVVLASYTLVVSLLMHALQMLFFLDFYVIHVCMLNLSPFTAT